MYLKIEKVTEYIYLQMLSMAFFIVTTHTIEWVFWFWEYKENQLFFQKLKYHLLKYHFFQKFIWAKPKISKTYWMTTFINVPKTYCFRWQFWK